MCVANMTGAASIAKYLIQTLLMKTRQSTPRGQRVSNRLRFRKAMPLALRKIANCLSLKCFRLRVRQSVIKGRNTMHVIYIRKMGIDPFTISITVMVAPITPSTLRNVRTNLDGLHRCRMIGSSRMSWS